MKNCLGLFFFPVTSQFTWHFMAIIKFTCFHTGGMCFAGTSTVVAAFCGCCSGSSGSGVFSLLAAPLYQLSYPRPDESSSPSSSLLPTTWVLVFRSCFPLLENAREVLFRAAPCPWVGILSGLERSLGMGGGCSIYWREMRQPLLRSAVEMNVQIDRLLRIRGRAKFRFWASGGGTQYIREFWNLYFTT